MVSSERLERNKLKYPREIPPRRMRTRKKTKSGEVEEVDVEEVELLTDLKKKAKGKKRKVTPSMQRTNQERKTSMKSTVPEAVLSKTHTASASARESKAETSHKYANAELVAEQRYESLFSREIVPERFVDLESDDTWGYLEIIRKGHLEKTITSLYVVIFLRL